jgi:natural product biosynthesis luciferase-like monooxygenase protein
VAPGRLERVGDGSVDLVFADGTLTLSELTTLEGDALGADALAGLGLRTGVVLASPPKAFRDSVCALDAELTKTERYWVSRLVRCRPPLLSELRAQVALGTLERRCAALPTNVLERSPDDQRALLISAAAAYIMRVGDEVAHVDLGLCVHGLGRELHSVFADVVPLALDVTSDLPLSTLIASARRELASATRRRSYARDAWTRYPALRAKPSAERALPIVLDLAPRHEQPKDVLPAGAQLVVRRSADGSQLELLFDSAALGPLHGERLASRLAHVMGAMAALGVSSTAKLAALEIVPEDERRLLLETFQNTSRPDVPIACIHDLIAASVARHPEKTAIVFRDRSLSYRELDRRANALAHELVKQGVGPDELVAISVERSLHMMIGLLAILKAGGAYVPLDPAYPSERLSIMLADSGARLLLTQKHLAAQFPRHKAEVLLVEQVDALPPADEPPASATRPEHLAYVIFTSGSTGRPKGVMVEHRNVANFFAGMDERIGTQPGTWLAVTSISFDISVLELFWTLARGFEVVIQEETDRASVRRGQSRKRVSSKPMEFGLFYFAADSSMAGQANAYRLLLEGARYADAHDFVAVWTPERHFHAFGGLYPNPAVTSAAVAAITSRVEIRAGSVVIPLHDPIRVAEEWAVVDNLSGGRVGLSFASGWHANDFALKPENYERRREVMQESIDAVLRLWAGEKISVKNGTGQQIEVSVLPRPIRERPPMWIASAGNVDTFRAAGRSGYNVLTNMLGQDIEDLANKFAAYREARKQAGHEGEGVISVMLHTFVTSSDDAAREQARVPFGNYLKTSYDLVKVAPWMFPAFKQPSLGAAPDSGPSAFDPSRFDEADMEALLDHAFDRYFDSAGLFGTPERALNLIEQLEAIGATEVACLIDFGIDPDVVLDNLIHLNELRLLASSGGNVEQQVSAVSAPMTIREQFERRAITHFQCTPSMARMLVADGTLQAMGSLQRCLVGGEALPSDLADTLIAALPRAQLHNMYGPTETTVWSTSDGVTRGQKVSIGTPIANTQVRILDRSLGLAPLDTPGELCIGGWGVVRGYFGKPELTAERFVSDPFQAGNRLYRTGDLARFTSDGRLEYIGRIDQQVKVNGYRIELGEIETLLNRHAAVKEAVVAVKDGAVAPELVGYVIAAGGSSEGTAPDVSSWKQRWNDAYSQRAGAADAAARFDTSGWLDSYTGAPIPREQMREWLDLTVERIDALEPKRVLEIGCGTGMLLYALLPQVEHYVAVDLSPHALETIRGELTTDERRKVTLLNQAAHELDAIADGSVDLVIINSVAQYFPSADYLMQVLERVSRCLVDGGAVFLGDVRALEEQATFHTLVEVEKAPGASKAAALSQRIDERRALETELLVGVPFFHAVEQRVARLGVERIQLKRGVFANEMRDFRSDVTLRVGARAPRLSRDAAPVLNAPVSIDAVEHALREAPPLLWIGAAKNARLAPALALRERMTSARVESVDELRALAPEAAEGIDPNALFALEGYEAELRFGEATGTFDALLRSRVAGTPGVWSPRAASGPVTSTPHQRFDADDLAAKLRTHLRDFLPEYMVPQSFVMLSAFPLTPNGKIDRKALPKPTERPRQAAVEFALPGNDLERTIADIWRGMLGVERVGRKDNIFDLGASSLLTVEANNRLQTALGRKVPLVTMFRYPTIESLANHLEKTGTSTATGAPTLPDAKAIAEQERQNRLAEAASRRRRARGQS